MQMLVGTAQVLRNASGNLDSVIHNALVESFALHCRALIHFLHGDARQKNGAPLFGSTKPTDVIAEDFFSATGAHWKNRPAITATLIRAKTMADKQIAHVTEQRRTLNTSRARGKTWHFARIHKHLSKVMHRFLRTAPNLHGAYVHEIRAVLIQ
ncbi:MAG: hypothetical protein KF861_08025 [Planctomycetaceae bacterium]|nr:hypothetical protein [Planctomycetaceae bacterium]